jgi:hypothetical protein
VIAETQNQPALLNLVDLRKLEPGDILLTKSGGRGTLIAWGTGGEFSHAHLMVTKSLIPESLSPEGGLLYVDVPNLRAYEVSGQIVMGYCYYGSVQVKRPKSLTGIFEVDRIRSLFIEGLYATGEPYATLKQLLRASDVRWPKLAAQISEMIPKSLSAMTRQPSTSVLFPFEGKFCSELVDTVLARVQEQSESDLPRGPNALAIDQNFEEISGAVLETLPEKHVCDQRLRAFIRCLEVNKAASYKIFDQVRPLFEEAIKGLIKLKSKLSEGEKLEAVRSLDSQLCDAFQLQLERFSILLRAEATLLPSIG